MNSMLKVAAVAVAVSALVGCTKATKPNMSTTTSASSSAAGTLGGQGQLTAQQLQQLLNSLPNKVYFAFDKYNLSPEAMNVLQQNAAVLLKNPSVSVMLAGNADPRGSVEYNFHLGMKRAKAVYDYFVQQGIPASQMCLVSYSDLKPAATPAQFGGNWQKAYAMDRRTEINYNQTCQGWNAGSFNGSK